MKRSINSKYHLLIAILLGLVILESVLLLAIVAKPRDVASMVSDLQTTIIIFVFLIFVYAVVIYNFIPVRIKRSLQEVGRLVSEISQGNYDVNIQPERFEGDKDIQKLLLGLMTMLRSVHGFDQAKENKIYEHDQRIKQLINLLPEGVLIALSNGDVSYCNDALRRKYPIINDTGNINDLILKDEFDKKIFIKISEALRLGDNLWDSKIPSADYKNIVKIDGSVIRRAKGDAMGGVFILTYFDNAEQNKNSL